jgi:HK97 family phage prohead protease
MKEAIISTERVNSYGSRVITAGIDYSQYEKNPILLYMHRRGRKEDMPIGIMTNLRVENGVLYGTPKFDDDTEDERNISKKWDRGTLRMLSAGLDVLEWSEDPAMLVAGQTRPTVTKSKLIEVSVVDIGSNDDALQVGLYHEGKLLTLAAGENNDHLPLLQFADSESNDTTDKQSQNNNRTTSMEKILLKLGLTPGSTEDQAVEAIGRLQDEKNSMTLARITDAVDTAIKDRRITADKKDKYLNLGKQIGLDSLNALFADMTPVQKPLDLLKPSGAPGTATDVKLTWATATAEQLADLRDNNRAEYVRLYKENFGFAPEI